MLIAIGVVVLVFVLFALFSDASKPKDRLKDAAEKTGAGCMGIIFVLLQFVFAAIPIAIAILLVMLVLGGC